jgi:apolipoprotein D and lipocalin family protein
MRRIVIALCCILMLAVQADARGPDLSVVPGLDVARYMGRWYEIAKYPNRFQSLCRRDTTADYRRLDSGKIEVVNRCEVDNHTFDQAVGEARPGDAPAKLEVRFAPSWLSWLPWVWAPYWVIQLAPDYRYAVIGEPDRKYLWILSRQPALSAEDENAIYAQLAEQGYDTGNLRRTEQTGVIHPN